MTQEIDIGDDDERDVEPLLCLHCGASFIGKNGDPCSKCKEDDDQ